MFPHLYFEAVRPVYANLFRHCARILEELDAEEAEQLLSFVPVSSRKIYATVAAVGCSLLTQVYVEYGKVHPACQVIERQRERLAALRSELRRVYARIALFFRHLRLRSRITSLIVVEARWFVLHGSQPPHLAHLAASVGV